ncbi:hypothetical protein KSP39_PZI011750 [Platanthera zijinensis]|uniref:Reverse transcriptase Ty1/copia-type domain-containing protein n=1 Tax=Platanthera zijinensis TaxID=2320716 RepID=A0AAP0BH38_9ASPA
MVDMGYQQTNADYTVFFRRSGFHTIMLVVYMDDIIIMGNDESDIAQLKTRLGKEYEVKYLRQLRYFIEIEVARSAGEIVLSQRKYVLDLLKEASMLGCRPAVAPIDQKTKLNAEAGESNNKESIGDWEGHMNAVYQILRYLKSAPGKRLIFQNNGLLNIESYCDSDWASCVDDRRSTESRRTLLWKSVGLGVVVFHVNPSLSLPMVEVKEPDIISKVGSMPVGLPPLVVSPLLACVPGLRRPSGRCSLSPRYQFGFSVIIRCVQHYLKPLSLAMEDLDAIWERSLSLTPGEDEVLEVACENLVSDSAAALVLVGRVLSPRPLNFRGSEEDLWWLFSNHSPVSFKQLGVDRRVVKLKRSNEELCLASLRYERLPNFCYFRGLTGHYSRVCSSQLEEGFLDPGDNPPFGLLL